MATVELVMPKMGESIMEATILKWHKHPGDHVKMDETVLEIATDKVDSEVPSTAEGVLSEVLFSVNDVVPIGAVIARIRTGAQMEAADGTDPEGTRNVEQGTRNEDVRKEFEVRMQHTDTTPNNPGHGSFSEGGKSQTTNGNGRFYSPLVLNIAAQEGVSMSELEKLPGTGNEGRVTKKDILQYVNSRKASGGEVRASCRQTHDHMVIPMHRVQKEESLDSRNSQLAASGNV